MKFSAMLVALVLFAGRGADAQEATAHHLQVSYAGEAHELRESLGETLKQQRTRDEILANLRDVHDYRDRKLGKTTRFADGIRLIGLSMRPPMIERNGFDEYQRFRSNIIFWFERYEIRSAKKKGSYKLIISATARPDGEWVFPDIQTVIDSLAVRVTKNAHGLLDMEHAAEAARAAKLRSAKGAH